MKPVVIIMGKLPPPYMGPAIATKIILESELNNDFTLVHVDTTINTDLRNMGKWSGDKAGKNLRICRNLISAINKHDPDLILIPVSQSTTGFLKDSLYILIAAAMRRKVILQLRGSDFRRWFDTSSVLTRSYIKSILQKTKGMIVLGNNLKYLFKGLYNDEQIFVVPNGADYTLPVRTRIDDSLVRIVYLGNLQSSKGIEDVIHATVILDKTHQGKYEVEVIGGWRNEATRIHCQAMVSEHHLPVKFFSQEESKNKLQHLVNSDVFLFPPREPEGHPWVIVEAMAAGLPVISSDQGAITESVIDGENGFIIPASDPHGIAEKLKVLIDNPGLRQRMGAESRKSYLQKFTGKNLAVNMSRTFMAVIRK